MIKYLLLLLLSFNCYALPVIIPQQNVSAKSYIVTDNEENVIIERNADSPRSIASITKLMTAIVVLDANQDLDEDVPIVFKNHGYLHSKIPKSIKTLKRKELINLAIVKSDNLAAQTLCENYPGGLNRCIAEMNHKAFILRMTQTHYEDPTGLNEKNASSAKDLVKLVIYAKNYSEIVEASNKSQVEIKARKVWWRFGNTNPIVKESNDIIISKTGFINASGGCIALLVNTSAGERAIILLGSTNTRSRITEARKLIMVVGHTDVEVTY
jgi:D-alanyl-D-alanine endopeptidase (penicillin-binding protein 7)